MRDFLVSYMELIQTSHDMVGQVHQDFKRQFLDMTVDKLLEQFVLNKYTGLEKPGERIVIWSINNTFAVVLKAMHANYPFAIFMRLSSLQIMHEY